MGKLMVVVGGQFGSEAKGACAAALAARSDRPLVVRTGGPNAGHTVWEYNCGHPADYIANDEVTADEHAGCQKVEYKLRQLPTAAVSNPDARLAIAAGSVVDPELLAKEIQETRTQRFIHVDEMATVLDPQHLDEERFAAKQLNNWSTQKGIGAARAARTMRTARVWRDLPHDGSVGAARAVCSDVAHLVRTQLKLGGDVIIEAAQGYGLGLHTPYYPKVTSADCRAIDALAAVGISPWFNTHGASAWPASLTTGYQLEVWVVMRPYPIRVAGESGPLRNEVSWAELGLPEEHTTVTNKVRRVGLWDPALAEDALLANGAPAKEVRVWFSMMDQVIPELAGIDNRRFWAPVGSEDGWELTESIREQIENWSALIKAAGSKIWAIGTGPRTHVWFDGGLK